MNTICRLPNIQPVKRRSFSFHGTSNLFKINEHSLHAEGIFKFILLYSEVNIKNTALSNHQKSFNNN